MFRNINTRTDHNDTHVDFEQFSQFQLGLKAIFNINDYELQHISIEMEIANV